MYLMHKDKIVAELEMIKNKPLGVKEVFLPEEMPVGTIGSVAFSSINIFEWHSRRTIPMGRVNYAEIQKLGDLDKIRLKSLGLSVTDSYWYKPEDSSYTWDDVNLYKNGFSSDLLLQKEGLLNQTAFSPDYTTNGCLEKFWICQNKIPQLVKAGGFSEGDVVFAANEVVAYRVANLLGIDAVPYRKAVYKENLYCVCPSFIRSDKEEFVSLSQIEMQIERNDDDFLLRDYLKQRGFCGYLDDMATIDILLHNYDRHLDNAGLIRDTDTKEYTRACPIFDTGSCLNASGNVKYAENNMRPFEPNIHDYAKTITAKRDLPSYEDIKKIVIDVYNDFGVSEKQREIALMDLVCNYHNLCFGDIEYDPEELIDDIEID